MRSLFRHPSLPWTLLTLTLGWSSACDNNTATSTTDSGSESASDSESGSESDADSGSDDELSSDAASGPGSAADSEVDTGDGEDTDDSCANFEADNDECPVPTSDLPEFTQCELTACGKLVVKLPDNDDDDDDDDDDDELHTSAHSIIYSDEIMSCILQALRDRTPAKFSIHDNRYIESSETTTVQIMADDIVELKSRGWDDDNCFGFYEAGTLAPPEHFKTCISQGHSKRQFDCMVDGLAVECVGRSQIMCTK